MSSQNYVLVHIMHMGDHVMAELSSDPDLLRFNLMAKILVKLAEGASADTVTGGVSTWANTWEIASWRSLFVDELVELKGSMELVWGETEEGTVLLNPELMFHTRRQCTWCDTQEHMSLECN
ncbi:hypothetical protein BDN67DRAFT_985612 [Paxillus ammoniavirescens]|nr:hypothetical protein BDN67DRAFT_985612 [Paxillus ammoniavirescens]